MTNNGPPLPVPTPWAAPLPAPPAPAGWPAPQWQPLAPPPRRTTNGWAIVALVAGLLAVVPLALGAGIVALVQIRRRGQAGVGLAVAGLVAAAVWTAVGVVAVVALVFLGSGSGAALGRVADADSAVAGDCLFAPPADRTHRYSLQLYERA